MDGDGKGPGGDAIAPATPGTGAQQLAVIETLGFADYALLDSGAGRKLERFGAVIVDRPEPQALWRRRLSDREWGNAHAVFSASGEDDEKGKWRVDKPVPESWLVKVRGVTMLCRLQGLWHLGLFPEQIPHWEWMLARLGAVKGETPRVLNLFGYTGAASLLAAQAGAEVTHVDASKKAIQWAKENQAASKLEAAPVRWILDEAAKFAAREVRRGRTYHVILVDPPKFGRGPEGEVWDLFAGLPGLLSNCAQLLAPSHASMVLTVYAIRASALAFDQLCRDVLVETRRVVLVRRARNTCRRRPCGADLTFHAVDVDMRGVPKTITSLTNERVKAIRALDMRKERKETGLFVAEGASILVTARDHGFVPETLVYQGGSQAGGVARELIQWALAHGVEVLEVSEAVLAKLASKDNPQSMLGVFRQRWAELPAPARIAKDAVWLALEEVRDPGNLGTIIRTVDAVGAAGVILIGNCCDPTSREAIRATMGSIFAVPLVRVSREQFLSWRAGWPGEVVGTHLEAKEDFRRASYKAPVLLVMGSEGPGLSESLTRSCTKLVKIPMAGKLDSLNLAVATALALYQLRGTHLKI